MSNYFNKLSFREQLKTLNFCRLIKKTEFYSKNNILKKKKIVIIGCGSQGLNQGLNMRDSGLNISFVLQKKSIILQKQSWKNATKNKFHIGTFKELIPTADLIINLTPDKQHEKVIKKIQPLMKKNTILGYSHGFNIIEIGQKIRKDITVIMVAPKCPGTEVRKEYKKNFGVPSLIAVHDANNPIKVGLDIAKAWAFSIGSHKAGVMESSFSAEVKSDLMGEQTILCGMMQTLSIVCFEEMKKRNINLSYAIQLIQFGLKKITESMKIGGISLMMERVSNSSKFRIFEICNNIKKIMKPLFRKHMDNILSGRFSLKMISDWNNNDYKLLKYRRKTKMHEFEKTLFRIKNIDEQTYFDHSSLIIAIIKAGVELSFEIMVESGIKEESAYYESLHELPLITNLIKKNRLYKMNMVISDTAEYGNYIFSKNAIPILKKEIHNSFKEGDLAKSIPNSYISNINLLKINEKIYFHPIEIIGRKLRKFMYNKII